MKVAGTLRLCYYTQVYVRVIRDFCYSIVYSRVSDGWASVYAVADIREEDASIHMKQLKKRIKLKIHNDA